PNMGGRPRRTTQRSGTQRTARAISLGPFRRPLCSGYLRVHSRPHSPEVSMSLGPERGGAGTTEPPAPPATSSALSVARLRAFYARHPGGAVRTSLVHRGPLVAVRAAVYRAP